MGVFQFNNRIGLGDSSAPGAFSLAMDSFLSPIRDMGFRNYFDDIAVAISDLQQIPILLDELVNRAIKVGATFKLSSLQIGGPATYFAGLKWCSCTVPSISEIG